MEKCRLAKHDEQWGVMCKHESQKGPVHHARLKHQEKLDTLVLPREYETKKHAPDLRILLLVCQIWPKASYPKTIIFPVNFFGHILGKTWQNHIYPLSYLSTCPSVYRHDSAWCPTCFSQDLHCFDPILTSALPLFSDLLLWLCPGRIWSQCSEACKRWRWSGLPARLRSCVWWFQCNLGRFFWAVHDMSIINWLEILIHWFMMDCMDMYGLSASSSTFIHPLLISSCLLKKSKPQIWRSVFGAHAARVLHLQMVCLGFWATGWAGCCLLQRNYSLQPGKIKIGHRNQNFHNQCATEPFNFHLNSRISNN